MIHQTTKTVLLFVLGLGFLASPAHATHRHPLLKQLKVQYDRQRDLLKDRHHATLDAFRCEYKDSLRQLTAARKAALRLCPSERAAALTAIAFQRKEVVEAYRCNVRDEKAAYRVARLELERQYDLACDRVKRSHAYVVHVQRPPLCLEHVQVAPIRIEIPKPQVTIHPETVHSHETYRVERSYEGNFRTPGAYETIPAPGERLERIPTPAMPRTTPELPGQLEQYDPQGLIFPDATPVGPQQKPLYLESPSFGQRTLDSDRPMLDLFAGLLNAYLNAR